MEARTVRQSEVSYDLYHELAGDLCEPIDSTLTSDVRLELYNSKIVYLKNIYAQCFVDFNRNGDSSGYSETDLVLLREAIDVTQEFLCQTVRECLEKSLQCLAKRMTRS